MFELFKRDRQIGVYSSLNSAQVTANKHRGEARAQHFTIKKGQRIWEAMLPARGQGRAKWRKARAS